MSTVFIWTLPIVGNGLNELHFMTPIGVAFSAWTRITRRLAPVRDAFIQRSNAPIILSNTTSPPVGAVTVTPAQVFSAGVPALRSGDIDLLDVNSLTDGRFVPVSNAGQGLFAVRLYGGMTYTTLLRELHAPEESIHAFSRTDAIGIAHVLSDVFKEISGRDIRIKPAFTAAPRAKRRRTRRGEDSDTESDDE